MKDKVKIELDKYEMGLIINSLNNFRNIVLKDKGDTTDINNILLKLIEESNKRNFFKMIEANER